MASPERTLFSKKTVCPEPMATTTPTTASSKSSLATSEPPKKTKLGWTRIQRKTEKIIDKIHEEKKKHPVSIKQAFSINRPAGDRSHRITEQIDQIRAEQIQILAQKADKKRRLAVERHEVKKSLFTWAGIKTIVIHPKSTWKQVWDIAILLLVVFSSVQIPLLLAFPDMPPLQQFVQITFDVIFLIDFAFCFRTGFIRPDNEVELDQGKIVSQYMKTWFGIDLAACFRKLQNVSFHFLRSIFFLFTQTFYVFFFSSSSSFFFFLFFFLFFFKFII